MITPRDYQFEAVNAIFDFFRRGNKGNPLVQAPTGSGKSIMISTFCNIVYTKWKKKVLIISHVKEILSQDYRTLKRHLKNAPIGLYSAGLKNRTIRDITVAGIQSIYNKPELFDQFDLIIVDEAHLIPVRNDGMYRKLFAEVKVPIIGFTATPFRLGTGYLHIGEKAFFDDIVYSISYKKLQDAGHLCKLSCKGTTTKLKPEGIKKQGGDYIVKELSKAFDREEVTKDIIQELIQFKDIRKKWLLFGIDIDHVENITAELRANGIKAACVHSRMKSDRKAVIEGYTDGDTQALVSVAVLTTGFDAPHTDLIGLLRPTSSPNLHVQIIGRGLRVFEGKEDCLILDFAGNLARNGPIDAPVIRLKGSGEGEAIMKECPNCFEIVHAAVRICPACNTPFQFRHHLSSHAKDGKVLSEENWHPVTEVLYYNYTGSRGIPMLKVRYMCGPRSFNEFVCLEHGGYPTKKAHRWWSRRSTEEVPNTAQEALEQAHTLKEPSEIFVEEGGKYPTIKDHKF